VGLPRLRDHERVVVLSAGLDDRIQRGLSKTVFYCTLIVPTMPGWIVQWYWNVPADENVLEKVAPGAIEPEFQAPPSAVDVCATVSLFVHVTVLPTGIAIGFGTKAVVVKLLAPLGTETVPPALVDGIGDGVGDTVGDGLDGEEEDPQPTTRASMSVVASIRKANIVLVLLPLVRARTGPPDAWRFVQ
jgi:hypothetical protein